MKNPNIFDYLQIQYFTITLKYLNVDGSYVNPKSQNTINNFTYSSKRTSIESLEFCLITMDPQTVNPGNHWLTS